MKNLETKRKFSAHCERVKSVDIHPTEPWVLTCLYNGSVCIWDFNSKSTSPLKSFEITEQPVRTGKFVARKSMFVIGSDDFKIRAYNYNTSEKLKEIKDAHSDYIRTIEIHPSRPFFLSSSDDMSIKLWDWDNGWICTQIFEGHAHYVMQVVFNPKDPNTFASSSLDRTVKIWGLGSTDPHFTLAGHEKGVNCVDYYHGGDKPYIVSGSDDQEVKVWDYQNKKCIQTLEGHTHNVSVVAFHPTMPFILTGSEDGTLRIYDSTTYRIDKVLNYGLDRIWSISVQKGGNNVAIGYDEGFIVVKLGSEEPAISMDHSGKIVWSKQNEIQQVNLMALPKNTEIVDGERISIAPKELGSCEIYPKSLEHSPNGRFVCVIGDGEYIIYTALAWRNKSYGSALHFVWAHDSKRYAIRESSSKVKIFNKFKQERLFEPNFSSDCIFGGYLLGVKSSKFLCFYDWDKCKLIRKIDVTPKAIYWSETGEMLTIVGDSSFFILKYNKTEAQKYLESDEDSDSGCEIAFDALQEINEKVTKGIWVGDCFVYTNSNNKLNYCIGEEVVTVAHLDKKMYLLGYIAKSNKLFLSDKSRNIFSYTLHVSIVNYQTAVLRGDLEGAQKILPQIPKEMLNRIAQFLDAQGFKELALDVATDLDHKFELAMQLKKFDIAFEIAKKEQSEYKWKQLGDMAISLSDFPLAEKCLVSGGDINALFLIYIISGNIEGIDRLSKLAMESGKNNIAFVSLFLQRKVYDCVDLLINTGRIPEAAFFARCYVPSKVPEVLKLWKSQFSTVNPKAAQSLADPFEYPNLFPNFELALKAEKHILPKLYSSHLPSSSFVETYINKSYLKTDLLQFAEELQVEDLVDDNNSNSPQLNEEDSNQIEIPQNNNKVEPKQNNNNVPQPKNETPPQSKNETPPQHKQETPPQHKQETPPQQKSETPPQNKNETPPQNKTETPPQIKNNDSTPPQHKTETPPQNKNLTSNDEGNIEDVMKDIEEFSSEEGGEGGENNDNLDWPEDFEDN